MLGLLAQGSTNKQIALALGLSLKTVQNDGAKILGKLQVADRTQAALRAQHPTMQVRTNRRSSSAAARKKLPATTLKVAS